MSGLEDETGATTFTVACAVSPKLSVTVMVCEPSVPSATRKCRVGSQPQSNLNWWLPLIGLPQVVLPSVDANVTRPPYAVDGVPAAFFGLTPRSNDWPWYTVAGAVAAKEAAVTVTLPVAAASPVPLTVTMCGPGFRNWTRKAWPVVPSPTPYPDPSGNTAPESSVLTDSVPLYAASGLPSPSRRLATTMTVAAVGLAGTTFPRSEWGEMKTIGDVADATLPAASVSVSSQR